MRSVASNIVKNRHRLTACIVAMAFLVGIVSIYGVIIANATDEKICNAIDTMSVRLERVIQINKDNALNEYKEGFITFQQLTRRESTYDNSIAELHKARDGCHDAVDQDVGVF